MLPHCGSLLSSIFLSSPYFPLYSNPIHFLLDLQASNMAIFFIPDWALIRAALRHKTIKLESLTSSSFSKCQQPSSFSLSWCILHTTFQWSPLSMVVSCVLSEVYSCYLPFRYRDWNLCVSTCDVFVCQIDEQRMILLFNKDVRKIGGLMGKMKLASCFISYIKETLDGKFWQCCLPHIHFSLICDRICLYLGHQWAQVKILICPRVPCSSGLEIEFWLMRNLIEEISRKDWFLDG